MKKVVKNIINLVKLIVSRIKFSLSISVGPIKINAEPSRSALVFFYSN